MAVKFWLYWAHRGGVEQHVKVQGPASTTSSLVACQDKLTAVMQFLSVLPCIFLQVWRRILHFDYRSMCARSLVLLEW
jgi:hypothetical protein